MRLSRFVKAFACIKSILKSASNLLSLSPLGHSDGFASCKARCVLISASLPKTPFHGKGLSVGLPPSPRLRLRPSTPFLITIEVFRQSEAFTFCESLLLLYKSENLKCRNSAYADYTADDIERLCAFLTDKTDKEKRYHYHRLYE